METKVLEQKENPLFSRKEVHVLVKDELTPSKEEARKIVGDEFKADPSLVRIRKIDAKFGVKEFVIIADVYDSAEEFKRIVKKTKQEIKAEEEARKAEEEARRAEEEAKKAAEEAAKAEAEAPVEEAEAKTE
jgi:ribosomal protein S24E